MLGESLSDPYGTESGRGSEVMRGLGLLPVDTVFTEKKTRTRVKGVIRQPAEGLDKLKDKEVEGYEIHMGSSVIRRGSPGRPLTVLQAESGSHIETKEDGCTMGNVCGTYVHGIFDSRNIAAWAAEALAEKKGISLEHEAPLDPAICRDRQYSHLASAVRRSLDMEAVYEIVRQGV